MHFSLASIASHVLPVLAAVLAVLKAHKKQVETVALTLYNQHPAAVRTEALAVAAKVGIPAPVANLLLDQVPPPTAPIITSPVKD